MFSLFFIDRPRFALVISVLFLLTDAMAINHIPVAQLPDITPPQVSVTTVYPVANVEVVEQSLLRFSWLLQRPSCCWVIGAPAS